MERCCGVSGLFKHCSHKPNIKEHFSLIHPFESLASRFHTSISKGLTKLFVYVDRLTMVPPYVFAISKYSCIGSITITSSSPFKKTLPISILLKNDFPEPGTPKTNPLPFISFFLFPTFIFLDT